MLGALYGGQLRKPQNAHTRRYAQARTPRNPRLVPLRDAEPATTAETLMRLGPQRKEYATSESFAKENIRDMVLGQGKAKLQDSLQHGPWERRRVATRALSASHSQVQGCPGDGVRSPQAAPEQQAPGIKADHRPSRWTDATALHDHSQVQGRGADTKVCDWNRPSRA